VRAHDEAGPLTADFLGGLLGKAAEEWPEGETPERVLFRGSAVIPVSLLLLRVRGRYLLHDPDVDDGGAVLLNHRAEIRQHRIGIAGCGRRNRRRGPRGDRLRGARSERIEGAHWSRNRGRAEQRRREVA